jgi:hypothetical protein
MASIPSLCIGYALDRCSEEQVAEVFNTILGENIVDSVKTLNKTNFKTQRPFKIFFINFKHSSDKLMENVERIKVEGCIMVEYDAPWFWKVTMAKPKEEDNPKGPRIMPRE